MNDPENETTDIKPATAAPESKKDAAEKKSPGDLSDDELDAVTGGQPCGRSH